MADQLTITCMHGGKGAYLVDQGRIGQRANGIPLGGPADRRTATRVKEILELSPASVLLEVTLSGGQWLISGKGQICLGGAEMNWKLNGRPAEAYTTIDLDGDYLLDGEHARRGCRAYLGIRGKWQVKKVLGSVSPGLPNLPVIKPGWSVQVKTLTEINYYSDLDPCQHCPALPYTFQVLPGPEWSWLTKDEQKKISTIAYTVGQDSNRQGLRFVPDTAFKKEDFATLKSKSLISSPVLPGTIQLTPSGPILLGCDAQTLGGFPRILLLKKTDDIDVAGQLKPGDAVYLNITSPT